MLQLFLFLRNLLWINMLHLVTDQFLIWTSFLARIQPHISSSPSFSQLQSAYRRHHSTETSFLHILDSILLSSDSGKSNIVVSLDLSAAFDTIDHQILLSRLNTSFGISDTTLSWLQPHRRKLLLGPGAQAPPHFYDNGARLYDEPPTFVM